jgi:hypothetical protein
MRYSRAEDLTFFIEDLLPCRQSSLIRVLSRLGDCAEAASHNRSLDTPKQPDGLLETANAVEYRFYFLFQYPKTMAQHLGAR